MVLPSHREDLTLCRLITPSTIATVVPQGDTLRRAFSFADSTNKSSVSSFNVS